MQEQLIKLKEQIKLITKVEKEIFDYNSETETILLFNYNSEKNRKIYNKYFSYLNNYLDDDLLIKLLDPSNYNDEEYREIMAVISYIFPKNFYYKLLEKYKDNQIILKFIIII